MYAVPIWEVCNSCIYMQKDDSGNYGIIGSKHKCKSIQELIAYYVTSGEPLSESVGDKLIKPLNKNDKWMIKYTEIEVQMRIGTSTFGDVCIGTYAKRRVSIKTYTGDKPKSINQFLLEAEVLKEYSHPNIAR